MRVTVKLSPLGNKKQTVSQTSNCHFHYCLFIEGPKGAVRRGGPWTGGQCFRVTLANLLTAGSGYRLL